MNRTDRIGQVLSAHNIDGLLVTPSADLLYLIGYGGHPSERPTVLAVTPGHTPVMVLPELEAPRLNGRTDIDIRSYSDGEDPYEPMQTLVGDRSRPIKLAISDQTWAAVLLNLQMLFPAASFTPSSSLMTELRMLKDPEEMELLHEAGRRADRAFEKVVELRFSGLTESELSQTLDRKSVV